MTKQTTTKSKSKLQQAHDAAFADMQAIVWQFKHANSVYKANNATKTLTINK
jgi:hypothetical protein